MGSAYQAGDNNVRQKISISKKIRQIKS